MAFSLAIASIRESSFCRAKDLMGSSSLLTGLLEDLITIVSRPDKRSKSFVFDTHTMAVAYSSRMCRMRSAHSSSSFSASEICSGS